MTEILIQYDYARIGLGKRAPGVLSKYEGDGVTDCESKSERGGNALAR